MAKKRIMHLLCDLFLVIFMNQHITSLLFWSFGNVAKHVSLCKNQAVNKVLLSLNNLVLLYDHAIQTDFVIDIDNCFYKSFSNISKCSWFAYQKNPYFGLLCIIGDISYLTEKDVKIYEAWMCILVGKIETVSVSLNCKQHIWHMNELVRILKSSFNLL